MAAELTASSRDDASTLPDLLAPLEVPIRRFTADGAYDHRSVYDRASAAGTENVVIVIPPRRSALSAGPTDGPWAQREASLQRIRKVGRREWQKESGYRQQARVENSFFRYKSVFGGDLKARHSELYRVARPPARDPKRFRVFVVVSRQALIDSRFSTIICAPVYSTRHGLATQVDVGLNEGLRHDSSVHCDELVSLRKSQLTQFVGTFDTTKLKCLDDALMVARGLLRS